MRVILAFGTRPEAIKMAPVYRALEDIPDIDPLTLLTGQHREQLEQALAVFEIPTTTNLKVMTERQKLPELAAQVLSDAAIELKRLDPAYILVHGDTLTTFVMAWVAFLNQIPCGHVEAGLRSYRLNEPFPEEANRRLTAVLTDLDFAPTPSARVNLLREGKDASRILVTGQTGVDAIHYAARAGLLPSSLPEGPYVTVTLHRRENWPILSELAEILARIASEHPEYNFVYPVHLNPTVREAIWPALKSISNFVLLDPLEYGAMASLLSRSELIVTDSGGLQEEGAALGVPVAVVRNVTERPEGIKTGNLCLATADPSRAYTIITELLDDPHKRRKMKKAPNPYGDGDAAKRVAQGVAWRLGLAQRPEDWCDSGKQQAQSPQ